MKQGLGMMKFVTNHPEEFTNPYYAFEIALMQCIGGISAELFCIIFLCSLKDPITVLISPHHKLINSITIDMASQPTSASPTFSPT